MHTRAKEIRTGDYGDITGFLAADTTNNLLVVSFRGSRTVDNWIANVDFPLESVDLCSGCEAHNGFWEAWQTVAEELSGKVTAAIAEYSGYQVVFTGHSFGGAMATLGATALRNDGVDIDLVCSLLGLLLSVANDGSIHWAVHESEMKP